MPIYEYECHGCGHRFERIQRFSDPIVEVCPACGERKIQKLLSSPAIQFKGTGWYVTDYAGKGASGKDSKEAGESGKVEPADAKSSADGKPSKEAKEVKESKDTKDSKETKPPATGT